MTDNGAGTLLRLDANGGVVQTVTTGAGPQFAVFDGANIWVPNADDSTISVVNAATGVVVATLSGNGLDHPEFAAFDGQRILVTQQFAHSVSLWRAADLAPHRGAVATGAGTGPLGVCSDGINFWITLSVAKPARAVLR